MSEASHLIYLYHPQVQRQAGLVLCSGSKPWHPCIAPHHLGQKEVNPLYSPSKAALGIQVSLSGFGKRNTKKKRRKRPGEV